MVAMSSLLTPSTRRRTDAELRADLRLRRPLALVAALGGIAAAASTLVVCMAVGVVGWFLTDAGAHGTPTGALRVGALGWLAGHGAGVVVEGVRLTAVPLGLTMIFAWATWRFGVKVGETVAEHGPDHHGLADGERDWTVPAATGLFTTGYVATALVVAAVAGTAGTAPSDSRLVLWSLLLCVLAGGSGIAVGSGRAAVWMAQLPPVARSTVATVRTLLLLWFGVSALAFAIAFVADGDTALNVMSQLHLGAGPAVLYVGLMLLVLPNATLFSSSYLLGPGFTVGTHTLVTPTAVTLGPVPMFPLLAALPDDGPTPAWTPYLLALGPLVAAVAVVLVQRRQPTLRWDHGAVRGLAAGVLGAFVVGILAGLAGGAVGPGRMAHVGPLAFDTLVHAVPAFGIGGLLAGTAMTWWQRRHGDLDADLDAGLDADGTTGTDEDTTASPLT
jgi:hypothetical protein